MNFAFFHIGFNNSLANALCGSIRLRQGANTNIVHLTDLWTDQVEGAYSVHRTPGLTLNSPMLSRMMAYRDYLSTNPGFTIFLDTDMLLVHPIPADLFEQGPILCRRFFDRDLVAKHMIKTPAGTISFPEHDGLRTLDDLYPYVGCFFADRSTSYLDCALDHYQRLNNIYHRWFGDQIALKYASEQIPVSTISEARVACLPDRFNEVDTSKVLILHYKGDRKAAMPKGFSLLKSNIPF